MSDTTTLRRPARLMGALATVACAALLMPSVAAAQTPAGAEYVEQVPGFAGGGQTTTTPSPPRRSEAPQRQSEPSQSAPASQGQQSQPTYSAPVAPQAAPKPRKRKRRVARPLGVHDTPPVTSPSSGPSFDITSGGGGNSLAWLALLLGAMTVVIPGTALYARRHGSH
jgi:hypothetical protein